MLAPAATPAPAPPGRSPTTQTAPRAIAADPACAAGTTTAPSHGEPPSSVGQEKANFRGWPAAADALGQLGLSRACTPGCRCQQRSGACPLPMPPAPRDQLAAHPGTQDSEPEFAFVTAAERALGQEPIRYPLEGHRMAPKSRLTHTELRRQCLHELRTDAARDQACLGEPPRSFRRLHLVRGRWSRGTSSNELSAGVA
jgi:hypothetical protein